MWLKTCLWVNSSCFPQVSVHSSWLCWFWACGKTEHHGTVSVWMKRLSTSWQMWSREKGRNWRPSMPPVTNILQPDPTSESFQNLPQQHPDSGIEHSTQEPKGVIPQQPSVSGFIAGSSILHWLISIFISLSWPW
jgi:hypothetical protein